MGTNTRTMSEGLEIQVIAWESIRMDTFSKGFSSKILETKSPMKPTMYAAMCIYMYLMSTSVKEVGHTVSPPGQPLVDQNNQRPGTLPG